MPPIFCPNCRIKIKANDTEICPKCGIKIGSKSHQPPTIPPPTNSSFQRSPVIVKNNVTEEKGNKRNWFFIGITGFVIVVLVFSYVIFGAGFFTTNKSQETVYSYVTEPISNIEMIGNVYGLADFPANGIDEIHFSIRLAPGSPTVDISKIKIVFSTPNTTPVILTYGSTASTSAFTSFRMGSTASPSLTEGQLVKIYFKVVDVPKDTVMNFEIRPPVGAALAFAKRTPPSLAFTNVLY